MCRTLRSQIMRRCQHHPASCPVSAEIGRNGPRPLTGYPLIDNGWRDAMERLFCRKNRKRQGFSWTTWSMELWQTGCKRLLAITFYKVTFCCHSYVNYRARLIFPRPMLNRTLDRVKQPRIHGQENPSRRHVLCIWTNGGKLGVLKYAGVYTVAVWTQRRHSSSCQDSSWWIQPAVRLSPSAFSRVSLCPRQDSQWEGEEHWG